MQRTIPVGDVQFVVLEKFLSSDNDFPLYERVIMNFYFWIKEKSLSEEKGFGLDQSNVVVEKFPLLINPVSSISLKEKLRNRTSTVSDFPPVMSVDSCRFSIQVDSVIKLIPL